MLYEVTPTTTEPTTVAPTNAPTTSSVEASETSTASAATTASAASTATGETTVATSTSASASTALSTDSSTTTVATSEQPTSTGGSLITDPPTFVCTSTGFFPHPTDPAKYYECVLIGAQFYYYVYSCPPSACFQESAGTCVVGTCSSSNTTVAPPPTTPAISTPPAVDIKCSTQGEYPFPGSCTKYYNCILLDEAMVYYVFECPPGSYFNVATSLCTTGQCPSTSPSDTTTVATTTSTATTPSTTTTSSTTTTLAPSTTAQNYPCPNEGYFVDPSNCQAYYRCIIINGQMYTYNFQCPAGAYWSSATQGCIVGTCPASAVVTTPKPSTTTAVSSTPQPFSCTQAGTFPDPVNCAVYHKCILISGQIYNYTYDCPPNTKYDVTKQLCVVGSC